MLVMVIWSHLPHGMKENGTVSCSVEVPSGTGYVDKVVDNTIFRTR
jgi:hypothetical protein